ncbi:hypothetical protein N181_21440 [Sinorhizobium fredii USDA 205]|nr:hypothetical protein SF83666_b51590 [Sinorhizobium fredii CCBAU 83666]KSV86346.1 hypothetical protein N181_21440 [Sinorhizobium fredii USDA 205]
MALPMAKIYQNESADELQRKLDENFLGKERIFPLTPTW